MLVLARKCEEKIHIGDNITITVLQVKGNSIRLGIEAPREVPVLRGELKFRTEREPENSDDRPLAASSDRNSSGTGITGPKTFESSSGWMAKSCPRASKADNREVQSAVEFRRVRREHILSLAPQLIASDDTGTACVMKAAAAQI